MLKKIVIKVIALTLPVFLLFGSGCGKNKEADGKEETENRRIPDKFLLKDGVTEYKVLMPAKPTERENFACSELMTFFRQASGLTIERTSDAGSGITADGKYLSVGKTALAKNSLDLSEDLKVSGYMLKTEKNSVIMSGYTDFGTIYAVYEFLRVCFGFRCYFADETAINKDVKTLNLYDFDTIDVPDIDLRRDNYGDMILNSVFARRRRVMSEKEIWMKVGGNSWHNSFNYIPPAKYAKDHRDWFCYGNGEDVGPSQLDYTNDEMRLELTETLKKIIAANPDVDNVTITQQDNKTWSKSPGNIELKEKYGTDAASMIIFCNKVARDIRAWLEEVSPGRRVTIAMFAYLATEKAPVTYNEEKGDYEPVSDEVILDRDVAVLYAPINADYNEPAESRENSGLVAMLKQWRCLTDKIYLWLYSTNFSEYLTMFNSFDSMQSMYKLAKEYGVRYLFDEGQYDQSNATGFSRLKMFLNSELAWDADADMDGLVKEFFENYYKDASGPMSELFEDMRIHYAYLRDETDMPHNIYADMVNQRYFPKGKLLRWLEMTDRAYAAIKPLEKEDPDLHKKLYDRINLESIPARYLLISVHASTFREEELRRLKTDFRSDVGKLGISALREGTRGFLDLWAKWGM